MKVVVAILVLACALSAANASQNCQDLSYRYSVYLDMTQGAYEHVMNGEAKTKYCNAVSEILAALDESSGDDTNKNIIASAGDETSGAETEHHCAKHVTESECLSHAIEVDAAGASRKSCFWCKDGCRQDDNNKECKQQELSDFYIHDQHKQGIADKSNKLNAEIKALIGAMEGLSICEEEQADIVKTQTDFNHATVHLRSRINDLRGEVEKDKKLIAKFNNEIEEMNEVCSKGLKTCHGDNAEANEEEAVSKENGIEDNCYQLPPFGNAPADAFESDDDGIKAVHETPLWKSVVRATEFTSKILAPEVGEYLGNLQSGSLEDAVIAKTEAMETVAKAFQTSLGQLNDAMMLVDAEKFRDHFEKKMNERFEDVANLFTEIAKPVEAQAAATLRTAQISGMPTASAGCNDVAKANRAAFRKLKLKSLCDFVACVDEGKTAAECEKISKDISQAALEDKAGEDGPFSQFISTALEAFKAKESAAEPVATGAENGAL